MNRVIVPDKWMMFLDASSKQRAQGLRRGSSDSTIFSFSPAAVNLLGIKTKLSIENVNQNDDIKFGACFTSNKGVWKIEQEWLDLA